MPRPAHAPNNEGRRLVTALAGYGAPESHIASRVGITEKTLRKHYRRELDEGLREANTLVAQSLFKKATDPKGGQSSVTAAIWWEKTRAGKSDKVALEHTGKDGASLPGPVNPVVVFRIPDNGRGREQDHRTPSGAADGVS